MFKIRIYIVAILILLASCSKPVSYNECIKYVNDPGNHLSLTSEKDGCRMKLAYRPWQLMSFQDISANNIIDENRIDSIENIYNQNVYFLLSLSCRGKDYLSVLNRLPDYNHILNQLSFELGSMIEVHAGKETIPLSSGILQSMYGYSSSTDIMLVFNNKILKYEQFIILVKGSEFGLFNEEFLFRSKDIIRIPEINYSKKSKI